MQAVATDAVATDCGSAIETTGLKAILSVVRERTGADFSRYRIATVKRRIANRMISVGAGAFDEYLDILHARDDEALRLLERITIKVSRFYRNKATFDALRTQVLPELARAAAGAPLRIWSAGCGCGEEPYTLAMLLDEACIPGVVEASDIDPTALAAAFTGRYASSSIDELPEALRRRYLIVEPAGVTVRAALRDRVRFSRRDLADTDFAFDAPFDLVCCRNVLIYFERGLQESTMHAVTKTLRTGGYLCLGEAEWPLPAIAGAVEPLAHSLHLFQATGQVRLSP